eukprot:gene10095-11771_t
MLLMVAGNGAFAQKIAPDNYAWTAVPILLGSASVTNPQYAIGPPDNNYADMNVATVLGAATATIQLKYTDATNPTRPLPTGTIIYVRLDGSLSAALLGLLLGGSGSVYTYTGATNDSQTAISGSPTTVPATLSGFVGSDTYKYAVITTGNATANSVVLQISGALLLGGGNLQVYHSFYIAPPTVSNPTVCAGNSINVTNAQSGYVYNWWTAATAGTVAYTGSSITPTVSGTYYLEANDGADFKSARIPVNIIVNPLPVVNPITGTTSVCVNSTTQLASTTGGGVWTSSDATKATVNSSGLVTGVAAGTATITYTVTNGSGCVTAVTTSVTTNALPVVAPITGTTSVCVNGTTQLASTTGGGVWTSSDATKATVNSSGLVTGVAAGTATITYTVTNGSGCVTAVTKSVTINALPVVAPITGTTSVCVNSTTQLASTTNGGVWTSSDATKATVNSSGLVTGVAAGTATITYTVTNGSGCVTAVTTSVTTNALPVVAPITGTTSVCVNGTTQLASTTGGGVWTSSDATKATVNSSGLVTGVAAGTATITYTVTNGSGCVTAVTKSVTINALPVVAPITGTTSVCVNSTTQLASTTGGGVWSSSDATKATVNSSGLVTGVAAGTATITYTVTNGNGCVSAVTTSVTINALPSITLGPVPNTCQENSSFTLIYTFTSGAPTSYSITWDSTAQSISAFWDLQWNTNGQQWHLYKRNGPYIGNSNA